VIPLVKEAIHLHCADYNLQKQPEKATFVACLCSCGPHWLKAETIITFSKFVLRL